MRTQLSYTPPLRVERPANHPRRAIAFRFYVPFCVTALVLAALAQAPLMAQPAAGGSVEGRVLNATTGTYLNNVRVIVVGTNIETRTNQDGDYRLANLPPGEVVIRAVHEGLVSRTASVRIVANETLQHDFELGLAQQEDVARDSTVMLEQVVVEATQLSAQASAINQQRTAPNIKNVVMLDEVGDLADGNVGEYLKYTPGLSITYGPHSAGTVSIRGMPDTGTLVMLDGAEFSSPSADREFDLASSASGNVDRVEVTKVPTPDLPANAVGGGVNIITKSGLTIPKRRVNLTTFLTYDSLDGVRPPGLGRSEGADSDTDKRRIQPGFDFSYTQPFSKTVALTLNAGYSFRYFDMEYMTPTWNTVTGVQTQSSLQDVLQTIERRFLALGADWRVGRHSVFRVNAQHINNFSNTRQSVFNAIFGTGATGDAHFTQGAATGAGTLRQTPTWANRERGTNLASLRFDHDGAVWRLGLNATVSDSWDERQDMEDGFFRSLTNADRTQLVLRADGLDGIYTRHAPIFTAWNRQGIAVDPYAADAVSVTSVTSQPNRIDGQMQNLKFDLGRDFNLRVPLALKLGADFKHSTKDTIAPLKSWTFNPPGGAAGRLAGNYDFVNDHLSAASFWRDTFKLQWLSPAKIYDLYREKPEYFVLDEANAHIAQVNSSKRFEETISSVYVRGDARFLDNRLWLVGGVRFERTDDEGWGPLNDVSATYRRDAAGNLLHDAAGKLIPITTNALEKARLQYVERGASAERSYQGYYPSLNASYAFTDQLMARVAFARTIGRPPLTAIIPGITVTDPALAAQTRTVTVINSGLTPWTADNFDLSMEFYARNGALLSASVFRKDIRNFFGTIQVPATMELLAQYGLSSDYLDYDVVTSSNMGDASITGIELNWRQSLTFLPGWAKGFQVFASATKMDRSGPNADDFAPFGDKSASWGISYRRKRSSISLSVSYQGEIFTQWTAASTALQPNTYQAYLPKTTMDLTFNHYFAKHFAIYGTLRNLDGSPKRTIRDAPGTPEFAKPRLYQEYGTMITVGLRSSF